jgi:hypothetical protein
MLGDGHWHSGVLESEDIKKKVALRATFLSF